MRARRCVLRYTHAVPLTRDLVLYLISRTSSGAGLTMMRAAIGWHLYQLTRSAFDLGFIGLVQLVPALALALPAGVIVDRYERRRVIQGGQIGALLAMAALAVLSFKDAMTPLGLFVCAATVSSMGAFTNPARAALLPALVPREHFPRAVTFASTSQALAFALGPAIAGALIASVSITAAYAGASVLIGVSFITLMFLEARPPPAHTGAITASAMLEGLRYVWGNKILLGAMSLDLFAVILGGAGALLPVFAHDVLQVGAEGYGLLSGALEVGALIAAAVMLVLPPITRIGPALLITVCVYGVATIVFGASSFFPLSLLAYAVAGMADQVSVVLRQTTVQLQTPDALRGRVSSVASIFIGTSNQLAAVEAGFVAALTSARFAVVTGGLGVLVVAALVAVFVPALRRYVLAPRATATA